MIVHRVFHRVWIKLRALHVFSLVWANGSVMSRGLYVYSEALFSYLTAICRSFLGSANRSFNSGLYRLRIRYIGRILRFGYTGSS
jgi:hypothetical protein